MPRRPLLAISGIGVVIAAITALRSAVPPAPAPDRPAYHADAEALERSVLAVVRSILRGEVEAATRELARTAELAPPLGPDRERDYGAEIYNGDRAFQITLTRAREDAADGNLDELFQEFSWLQRTCLHCHTKGRSPAPRQ
jgi:hypothetical protein